MSRKNSKDARMNPKKYDDDDDIEYVEDDGEDFDDNSDEFREDEDEDSIADIEEEDEKSQNDDTCVEKKIRFLFSDQIVFNKLPNSELTNNYQNPWKSIDLYIKTMLNLTVENFIGSLRKHLLELKNNQLDPRDLYLYNNVHVCPIYDYYIKVKSKYGNDQETLVQFRSNEHDLFIQFTVRAPRRGSHARNITVNWDHTERLRKRSLLIFSTNPYMKTIEAVGYSCAKKGTIQDNIVPIKLLQGKLDIYKDYFMFEPVDQWNEAIVDNLLNSNSNTIPQCLIDPFVFLDFSNNSIESDNKLIKNKVLKSLNVDDEQLDALKYSLENHLTLVNGAPGTGKTHLGCEVVKYLIESNYDSPILVVTYKNVSLDNFLDKLSGYLEKNQIDFIRIGGKPRTKNNFILEHDYAQGFPNRKLKRELLYVMSLLIIIDQGCITELDMENFGPNLTRFINEIDKIVSLRMKLFDRFPFYTAQEELLIVNFLIPLQFIPQSSYYFISYMNGSSYFNEARESCRQNLMNHCSSLLIQIKKYYTNKIKIDDETNNDNESSNNSNRISSIIENHFKDDEDSFIKFLSANKKKVIANDISLLYDIIEVSSYVQKTSRLHEYILENVIDFWDQQIMDEISRGFDSLFSSKFSYKRFSNLIESIPPMLEERKERLEELIERRAKTYQIEKTQELGETLAKKKLIAMTATRAAQFKESLDLSNCKYMIFEEAGELTEPITFSIIPKTVQQLMMIGDYNQLRPTVDYDLVKKPFNFEISLFEKVVIHSKSNEEDNLFTLSIQRRMHPQIASMLRRAFYDNNRGKEKLIDDESVKSLDKPIGFPNHLQFYLHEYPEESEQNIRRSHINIEEAKICAFLFLMMLCRGYKSTEVTIISLYKGQKKQIEREISNLMDKYYSNKKTEFFDAFDFENDFDESSFSDNQIERLKSIDKKNDFKKLIDFRKSLLGRFIKCLDDFQGEENEVIIVSLTRSEKPGFLSSINRSLVTLSRAKQMEFVIGNLHVFGPQNEINPLWSSISSQFTDDLTLSYNGISACGCPIHEKTPKTYKLSHVNTLMECRFNCCRRPCDSFNNCKHTCEMPCHFHKELKRDYPQKFKLFERRYYCPFDCKFKCANFNHQINEKCGFCTHFGAPKCPFKCEFKCAQCSRRCVLNCSHKGNCQIGHLDNYLNLEGSKYICDECRKKNEIIRKNKK